MASIYELNQPPNHPFWDMLANIQNHPFFGPGLRPNAQESPQPAANGNGSCPEPNESAHSTGAGPWGYGYPHPLGFGFGFGQPFGGMPYPPGSPFGGEGWGGPGPGASSHRGRGRGHGHGRGRGCHPSHAPAHGSPHDPGQSNTHARETAQNIASVIEGIATNLGISLDQILSHHLNPQNQTQSGGQEGHTDFTPPVDIIDTPAEYIVHVSLPGAKKDDLTVEYDGAESVLRVAGVVYRPGVNEEMHAGLVVQERKKEVGVFERLVRLGTAERPAEVAVEDIVGRLEDGVLRVLVPRANGGQTTGKNTVIESGEDESGSETVGETGEYVRVQWQ